MKKYRRILGLTQKQVAAIIGVQNPDSISRWEKGERWPSVLNLFRLSYLYKTLPNHLYGELCESIKKAVADNEKCLGLVI